MGHEKYVCWCVYTPLPVDFVSNISSFLLSLFCPFSSDPFFCPFSSVPFPSDHHFDRPVENCSPTPPGPRGQEAGSLLRVRSGRPLPPHVHLRPHRPLAGLHLVRRHDTQRHMTRTEQCCRGNHLHSVWLTDATVSVSHMVFSIPLCFMLWVNIYTHISLFILTYITVCFYL